MMLVNKPVIGICHGCFLLADVLGGKVIEVMDHQDTEHTIWYKEQQHSVNSYHSLGIAQPHQKATVLAVDADSHCEAWIDGNLAGVAWHPERMSVPWLPQEIDILFKGKI